MSRYKFHIQVFMAWLFVDTFNKWIVVNYNGFWFLVGRKVAVHSLVNICQLLFDFWIIEDRNKLKFQRNLIFS